MKYNMILHWNQQLSSLSQKSKFWTHRFKAMYNIAHQLIWCFLYRAVLEPSFEASDNVGTEWLHLESSPGKNCNRGARQMYGGCTCTISQITSMVRITYRIQTLLRKEVHKSKIDDKSVSVGFWVFHVALFTVSGVMCPWRHVKVGI